MTVLGDEVKLVTVGGEQAVAVMVTCAVVVAPQPLVAVSVYVVVDCGWVTSTKPLATVKVPIPGLIVRVRPVPEVSVMDHASRTIWLPPITTVVGLAVNAFI